MPDQRADPTRPIARHEHALPGRISRSPDPPRIRNRRPKSQGWRRKLFDYVVVPAEVPADFNEPLVVLFDRLSTDDEATAATILDEARAVFDETAHRIEGAERRATTLQGTAAIAASLVVAGGGLLLDPAKIADQGWRVGLLVLLVGFLGSLIACAWRALAVTGRIFEFEQPGPERIFLRAKLNGIQAQTARAAELLRAAGVASEIGAVKVGLLRSAAWWLRVALAAMAAFGVVLCLYVATGNHARSAHPTPSPRSSARH